jgi:tripartite-type tricarboxylate transporter receptor subunit TctC
MTDDQSLAGARARRRSLLLAGLMLPAALLGWQPAQAQAWSPSKPLRMIVTFPPGGTADLLARLLAPPLGEALGQSVVVDNRAGGGGVIGSEVVARSGSDGLTFGLVAAGSHALNATMMGKNLPYDPVKDFQWITPLVFTPFVLVVNASNPAHTVAELVERAKAAKVPLNFGSPGVGTMNQIAGETMRLQAKIPMTHVAYKGGAPAMNDIMGGQLDMMFNPVASVQPFVKGGRMHALAIGSKQRLPEMADVPTMAEAGFPGFEAGETFALVAPSTMPPAAVARLNSEVAKLLRRPEIADKLKAQGMEITVASPAAFNATMVGRIKEYAELIQRAGIKAE